MSDFLANFRRPGYFFILVRILSTTNFPPRSSVLLISSLFSCQIHLENGSDIMGFLDFIRRNAKSLFLSVRLLTHLFLVGD